MAEVPGLDYVRELWVGDQLDPLPREVGVPLVPEYERAFNAMVAQVKAEAWDEAMEFTIGHPSYRAAVLRASNPYRAAEREAGR
ncbi:MAG: hypothetical protein M0Z51_11055 [Propionibacterium sp.]|nr:hypothetical protein [Propionibacterium sp.]